MKYIPPILVLIGFLLIWSVAAQIYNLPFMLPGPLAVAEAFVNDIDIVFALIVPEKEDSLHIDLLSNIAAMLEDKSFLLDIRNSTSKEEIKRHIQKFSH